MKSALIIWGGWEGHEPEKTAVLVARGLRERGFKVMVSNTLDSYRKNDTRYDVIVQNWTMGDISSEQLSGLLSRIRSGTGFAGWHGGAGDAFRAAPKYQFMVGGQWVAHPTGITKFRVNITKPEDPIVKGIKDFSITSEQYYMHVDPSNEVLADTIYTDNSMPRMDGTKMPVVWKRRYGLGRVFYSSLGHSTRDFEVSEVFEITMRGIQWAAGAQDS